MNRPLPIGCGCLLILLASVTSALGAGARKDPAAEKPLTERIADFYAAPARGFVSRKPARDWERSLLTGNGTTGAMVMGNPCDEIIYLSHAALYLPKEDNDHPCAMAKGPARK